MKGHDYLTNVTQPSSNTAKIITSSIMSISLTTETKTLLSEGKSRVQESASHHQRFYSINVTKKKN